MNGPQSNRNAATERSECRAFTLIELMVVIVLVAILTAVILPEMKGTYEDALLRSTSRKLIDACNVAYSRAVSRNEQHRLRIDAQTGRYLLERPAPASAGEWVFVSAGDVPGGEGQLDARVAVEIRNQRAISGDGDAPERADDSEEGEATLQDQVIAFYADGTADRREIVLRDRAGFQLLLRVNPITARIRVIELERE